MNDLRLSFEYEFKSRVAEWCHNLLDYNEEQGVYTKPDTQYAYMWYCRGYINGERG